MREARFGLIVSHLILHHADRRVLMEITGITQFTRTRGPIYRSFHRWRTTHVGTRRTFLKIRESVFRPRHSRESTRGRNKSGARYIPVIIDVYINHPRSRLEIAISEEIVELPSYAIASFFSYSSRQFARDAAFRIIKYTNVLTTERNDCTVCKDKRMILKTLDYWDDFRLLK